MLKNISFLGKVVINTGKIPEIKPEEFAEIQKKANILDCDAFIEGKKEYKDGTAIFEGYADKNKRLYNLVIDLKYPLKTRLTPTEIPLNMY